MVYGILVVYYENYLENSIENFHKLLKSLGVKFELIIISNNPGLIIKKWNFCNGKDLKSEFSGWDVGISTIKALDDDDLLIFANDTFCNHRTWGWVQKKAFKNAFLGALNSNFSGIIGEVDSFSGTYEILKCKSKSWVSTYLFAMSGDVIKACHHQISLTENEFENIIICVRQGNIIWGSGVNDYFKTKISIWLDNSNANGWYKKNSNDNLKFIKAKAIVNELYISALVNENKLSIRNVYTSVNTYLSIYYRIHKILRKIKLFR